MSINVCNILFDDKFKTFIKKMKDKFINYLEESALFDIRMARLAEIQEIYRRYFDNHKDEITLTNKTLRHQEYFAVLVSLIIPHIDKINKFEEVLDYYHRDFTVLSNATSNSDNDTYCACCHIVTSRNTFYLKNIITNYTLLIGCDCILKYKILSREEMEALKKERKFNIFKNKLYLYGINKDEIDEWFYCGGNNKTGSKYFKDLYKESPRLESGDECVCGRNITGLENHYISKDNENFLIICKECKKFFKKKVIETDNSKKIVVCDHCQGTGQMYYCDDCYGDCMFCEI
jgi:hypothetical protein